MLSRSAAKTDDGALSDEECAVLFVVGASIQNAAVAADRIVVRGLAERDGVGKYQLTEKGREALVAAILRDAGFEGL
jgi:hypothetical protein